MVLWIARLTLLSAAITAVLLARIRRDHRVFAGSIVWIASASTLRAVLAARFVLVRPLGSPPFVGAERVAFHVHQALGLSLPAALAITTILVFARHRWLALFPALAWAAAVAYLATHYPEVRGDDLRLVYLGAELAALVVAIASIVTWGWRLDSPTPPMVSTLMVCCIDGGLLIAGAQRWGFWSRWDLQQYAASVLYLSLTLYQVLVWRYLSRSQSPSLPSSSPS